MDSIRNLGLNILEYLGVNNYDKITDNIYCCRSGSAADTQAIANIVKANLEMHEMDQVSKRLATRGALYFYHGC